MERAFDVDVDDFESVSEEDEVQFVAQKTHIQPPMHSATRRTPESLLSEPRSASFLSMSKRNKAVSPHGREKRQDEFSFQSEDEFEDFEEEDFGRSPLDELESIERHGRRGEAPPMQYSSNVSKVIVHVDIDCFYAQVETLKNPALRGKPLGIQQKQIIATCNYVARARGVKKLEFLADAKAKCPELIIVDGSDLAPYREMSEQICEYMHRFSDRVQRLGFDETFMDVTHIAKEVDLMAQEDKSLHRDAILQCVGHFYCPSPDLTHIVNDKSSSESTRLLLIGTQICQNIREGLYAALGFTSCGGIGISKISSKMAAGMHKPDQQTMMPAPFFPEYLSNLECRSIPGCGRTLAVRLMDRFKISKVRDLRTLPYEFLCRHFGEFNGKILYERCRGIDNSEVEESGLPKSMTEQDAFEISDNFEDTERRVGELLSDLCGRINRLYEQFAVFPSTFKVSYRLVKPERMTKGHQFSFPIKLEKWLEHMNDGENERVLLSKSMDHLRNVITPPFHFTLLGVTVSQLRDVGTGKRKAAAPVVGGENDIRAAISKHQALASQKKSKSASPQEIDEHMLEVISTDTVRAILHKWAHVVPEPLQGIDYSQLTRTSEQCSVCSCYVLQSDMSSHREYHRRPLNSSS